MRVLVTGGTGLVGSRLIPRLVTAGIECNALVRPGKSLPSGAIPFHGDLLDPDSLTAAVKSVDAVVHLAAVLRSPDEHVIWKTNVDGTRNLIEATRQHAPNARLILASTGLVYGKDLPGPAREIDPAQPAQAYPASKIAAEAAVRDSGLTWSVLRLGFVYGEADRHLQSAPRLMANWKWHPAQRLSLIHHADIAAAIQLALAGAFDGRAVNIVDESPMSVLEIAQIVGAEYGASSDPTPNPWSGQLDGGLARTLGFIPSILTARQAARMGSL